MIILMMIGWIVDSNNWMDWLNGLIEWTNWMIQCGWIVLIYLLNGSFWCVCDDLMMVGLMIVWWSCILISWLMDWLIHWFIDSLIHWFIDSFHTFEKKHWILILRSIGSWLDLHPSWWWLDEKHYLFTPNQRVDKTIKKTNHDHEFELDCHSSMTWYSTILPFGSISIHIGVLRLDLNHYMEFIFLAFYFISNRLELELDSALFQNSYRFDPSWFVSYIIHHSSYIIHHTVFRNLNAVIAENNRSSRIAYRFHCQNETEWMIPSWMNDPIFFNVLNTTKNTIRGLRWKSV